MKRSQLSSFLVVSAFVFCILTRALFAEPRPQLESYCQEKRDGKVVDKSVTRTYEQGVGFNPAQYVTQWYTARPKDVSNTDLVKDRKRFRIDSVKAFVAERGAVVLDVPVVLMLVDGMDWAAIQSRKTALGPAVGVFQEKAEVDCRTGKYVYSVEFLMPKNPLQVLPYPLRSALEGAVDQAVGQAFNGALSDGLTFRLDDIVDRVRKTLAANERVSRETAKPDGSLRLLNPRLRELFPQDVRPGAQRGDAFSVGEYRLSPEMAYIMEQIVRRFLRRPELDKDAFIIVVRGYADAKPVHEIAYAGNCDINIRPNVVTEFTAANGSPSASPSTITSNSQLSIARGCEGAKFAKSLIPAARRIRVFYSGVSAIAGAPQETYRGIELRLERSL